MRKPKNSFEVKKTGKQGLGHVEIIHRLHLLCPFYLTAARKKKKCRQAHDDMGEKIWKKGEDAAG